MSENFEKTEQSKQFEKCLRASEKLVFFAWRIFLSKRFIVTQQANELCSIVFISIKKETSLDRYKFCEYLSN